jgi:23S rRNA (cytosine1962-C5)-methyltransferase
VRSVRIRRETLPDHPWIYRKQIARADPGTRNGDPVRILTKDGTPSGAGLFHGKSRIALRVLSREPDAVVDREFLAGRIDAAVRLRREVLRLEDRTDAYRIANSEGDGLSGLIVDRYGSWLSIQVKCLAFFRLAGEVVEILSEHFPGASVAYRRDAQAERIEGFRVPEPEGVAEITSDGIRMEVDIRRGHKTGSFLDQRDNRVLAASLAEGRDVLDLFCYEGSFALACAAAGARSVRGVDLDEAAIERALANAERNGLDCAFEHGDAFDALRARPRADLLLLDPPKWISSREEEEAGKRRYLDLNALGIGALSEGGLLLTSSCSGRLSPSAFLEILRRAAARAGRSLTILDVRGAAPDHPVPANFPEGRYLTAVLARVG